VRQRISNQNWDPQMMLEKALRGDYPSANKRSEHRQDEIAYWRERCGLAPIEIDEDTAAAAEALEPDADEAFLAMTSKSQHTLIHSYLLSTFEQDWQRGAYLCRLANLRLPAESHAAYTESEDHLARWQRRQRMAARKEQAPAAKSGARREMLVGGMLTFEEIQ
jgi:hypothetical protein